MRVVHKAGDLARSARRSAGAKPDALSAIRRCSSKNTFRAPSTSKCRFSAIKHGNVIHLHERDCSVQRRHQKVVEIAPSASACRKRRQRAVRRRRRGWRARFATTTPARSNFSTISTRHEWFFIEMNPRIQVEHTVTEVITGIRSRARANPDRAGLSACTARKSDMPPQDADSAQRLRHPMPRHHRGSGKQIHARLRQDSHLPLAGRFRHPARWRHGLCRRGHHAVLRFAAGEGHRVSGQTFDIGAAAHGPRACANSAFAA